MPDQDKTWLAFKEFFATYHQEWLELQIATAGAGFQSTNRTFQPDRATYQQDTVKVVANLATSTASDRAAVAALTVTNSTITSGCTTTHTSLVLALQDITKLQGTVVNLCQKLSAAVIRTAGTNIHYCWTCGYQCDHASSTCTNPAAGHQKDATKHNKKGGTNKISKST